eukprot:8478356-Alexandrium_andersonii.AAC.1
MRLQLFGMPRRFDTAAKTCAAHDEQVRPAARADWMGSWAKESPRSVGAGGSARASCNCLSCQLGVGRA